MVGFLRGSARFCRRFDRRLAHLLEMQLADAASVRLRDRDEVIVDLDLLALFRKMA